MKQYPPTSHPARWYAALVLSSLLAACSSSTTTPAPTTPTLAGGTWSWVSEVKVTTPKNGGAATTRSRAIALGDVTSVYTTDGKVTSTVSAGVSATGAPIVTTGTYVYAGGNLTYTTNGQSYVSQVTALTATTLTEVSTISDANNTYTTTNTSAR